MVELLQFHCFDKVFKENTSMSVMFFWFNNFAILTIVETVNDGIVGDGRELTTWRFHFLDDIICILLGGNLPGVSDKISAETNSSLSGPGPRKKTMLVFKIAIVERIISANLSLNPYILKLILNILNMAEHFLP